MAGTISTGAHPKSLWPGVNAWYGLKYAEHPQECNAIFEQVKSSKGYEEDVEVTSFGLAVVKAEGASVSYDSHSQGETKRYTHVAYALGYIVTKEEIADNLYTDRSFKRAGALAFSMRQTREVVGGNIFNRANNTSYLGADSVSLLSIAHPSESGNQANEPSSDTDFSEAALEDVLIQIHNAKNARGLRIALQPKKMIIPADLLFDVTRVLKSDLQSGTANNDINAIRSQTGLGFMVNHYITDTDAWFVQTNCPDGLKCFNRASMEFTKDGDFDTDSAKAKAYERYSFGWTDWRGVYGSVGAG